MVILILFAFISGFVTILSPCILPVLPLILSNTVSGGKERPFGIVTGFVFSFTFFTLFLSAIVRATGISADNLRTIAVFLLIFFGASLLIPSLQLKMELFFSKLSAFSSQLSAKKKPTSNKIQPTTGFISGLPIGASLGLLWAPCVGPILASVITLAATSRVNSQAVLITLAYSLGTAIPMFGIIYGGRTLLTKNPWLLNKTQLIQKIFGVIMIATAVGIFLNVDRMFQTIVLTAFPNYGTGLTKIEEIPLVKNAINSFTGNSEDTSDMNGKSLNDIPDRAGGKKSSLPRLGKAPGFAKLSGEWINSPPLTMEQLKGKVVLVDFWTYTCINCIRTLPYIRTWYDKYKDKGFVIVGVHTPEFEFEKNISNVKKAVTDFKLTYPIVQDNNYGIWQDYDNHYWPAHYLIDKDGFIRDEHFGEGEYDQTEQNIQTLLGEAGENVTDSISNPEFNIQAQSQESYLGYGREAFSVSPEQIIPNKEMNFTAPSSIPPNKFAYEGKWTLASEYAMPSHDAGLQFNFNSQQVFLVMRPKVAGIPGSVKIQLNNAPISQNNAGEDVMNGVITVSDDRLYKLIKLPKAGQGILQLKFLDDNVEVYAFTFG